uniref:Histone-lysine N-methyltransferase, H3 lysine-79 specific n=1 Tax=Trypanosoma congolense (strain IL3000) TaxID=1068625 RepID=G0UIQ6_TRYCI|nr:putative histone-lysine N-methyltransferase [Trypanosoma congolense IL3000]
MRGLVSVRTKRSKSSSAVSVGKEQPELVHEEKGTGLPGDPFVLPLRERPNRSGCRHCVENSCDCTYVTEELQKCYASLSVSRQVMCRGRRELCAKSVLPPFVSRLIRVAKIIEGDTFYDLGCGNGSVVFQVALSTGARCIGIEINPHNAAVARDAWERLRPIFEKRCGRVLDVSIICGDMCSIVRSANYFASSSVVWIANLLMPRPVNHFLSERLRLLTSGCRVLCMEDLFPHSRPLAAKRDPDAFEKFEMVDYHWQLGSVEWSDAAGAFFLYVRR